MKKRLRTILICSLAFVLAATGVGYAFLHSATALAQESFTGLSDIISSHSGDNDAYVILEIVPDYSAAKIGFWVEDSEPFYVDGSLYVGMEELLSYLSSKEEDPQAAAAVRTAYLQSLATSLSDVIATGAISYSEYSESFAYSAKATLVELSTTTLFAAGTSGLEMVAVNGGEYDLILPETEEADETDVSGGDLTDDTSDDVSGGDLTEEEAEVQEAEEPAEEPPEEENAEATEEDADPATEDADEADAASAADDADDADDADEADAASAADDDADDADAAPAAQDDDEAGETPDEDEDEVQDEEVAFISAFMLLTANYTADADEDDADQIEGYYVYVGTGNGSYRLVEGGSLDYDAYVGAYYYSGGFTNNNYLRDAVFNQSGEESVSNLNITVKTMLASEVSASDVAAADFIFLSAGSAYASSATYTTANDLSEAAAYAIYAHAKITGTDDNNNITGDGPVLLEQSILSQSGTNLNKLVTLLESASDLGITNLEDYQAYSASDVTTVSDSDNHYVNGSVYVVPGDATTALLSNLTTIFLDDTSADEDTFIADAEAIGFGEIAETIVTENFYRQVENAGGSTITYGYFDQTISKATALSYIITYSSAREEYVVSSINVLDIEPTSISNTAEVESRILEYLGITDEDDIEVTFTHMESSAFIGKVEDLNNYDLIYFGLETGSMTTSSGRTTYNDSTMNGLVYVNIGDSYSVSSYQIGMMDTDYQPVTDYSAITVNGNIDWTLYNDYVATYGSNAFNRYTNRTSILSSHTLRKSGNDITDEKVNAVIQAVQSGIPVILADNFLTTKGSETVVYDFIYDTEGNSTGVNGYIDNCSKVYELIDAIKDYANVMTESDIINNGTVNQVKQSLLMDYVQLGKPIINFDESTIATDSGQEYITATDGVASFTFTVSNYGAADASGSFRIYMYADYNADGRFAASEAWTAYYFSVTLNGKSLTAKTDSDGLKYYELTKSGSSNVYKVTFSMEDYVGVLPIKVVVTQSNNTSRYDSEVLYYYHHADEKATITVLQILPVDVGSNFLDLDRTEESKNNFYQTYGELCGITKYTSARISSFYDESSEAAIAKAYYASNLADVLDVEGESGSNLYTMSDFTIDIDSVFADDYATVVAAGYKDCLLDYDMVIIGFADCYRFLLASSGDTVSDVEAKYAEAFEPIETYINMGKSVLLTHDTTDSSMNVEEAAKITYKGAGVYWGVFQNKYIAKYASQNRYGVFSNALLQTGISGITSTGTTTYSIDSYYSLMTYLEELEEKSSSELTSAEAAFISDAADGSVSASTIYNSIVSFALTNSFDVAYAPNSDKTELLLSTDGYNNNAVSKVETNFVELTNMGQILIYPYNLLEQINSTTYTNQWGVPSTKEAGTMYITTTHTQYFQLDLNGDDDGDGQSDTTVWLTLSGSSLTQDVRNNYYIYTRGNVTYSGVGHNSFEGNIYEILLYVNTMITAYNAGTGYLNIQKENADLYEPELEVDTSVIYVSTDYTINEDGSVSASGAGTLDAATDCEVITLTITDESVTDEENWIDTISFYMIYADGDTAPDGAVEMTDEDGNTVYGYKLTVYDADGNLISATVEDEETGYEAVDVSDAARGTNTYTVEVPYYLLGTGSAATLRIVYDADIITTTIVTTSDADLNLIETVIENVTSYSNYVDITIQTLGMFDLK